MTISPIMQCEEIEEIHIRQQAETYRQLFPGQIIIQEVPSGGIAIRTLQLFRGKLNRAVGIGKRCRRLETDLKALEAFFAGFGLGSEVHLSPIAHSSATEVLLSNGYTTQVVLGTQMALLSDRWSGERNAGMSARVIIAEAAREEKEEFIEASIAGLQDNGRSQELLDALARIATTREDTQLFLAKIGNRIAGTAALTILETDMGQTAHLYLDSTLPEYRGRGIQLALLEARLKVVQQLGIHLATAITTVESGSARNVERAGMQLAYTTTVFAKDKIPKNAAL
jgi:GNAT superfamily N-acetyltransferase